MGNPGGLVVSERMRDTLRWSDASVLSRRTSIDLFPSNPTRSFHPRGFAHAGCIRPYRADPFGRDRPSRWEARRHPSRHPFPAVPSTAPSFLRTGLSSFLPRAYSDPSACAWIRSFVFLPRHLSFSRHLRLSTTTTSRSPSRNGRSRIHGSIFSFARPREPGIEPGSTGSDARSNPGSRPTAPSDGDPETSHGWDEGTPSKHEHDRPTKIRPSTRRHGAKRSVETHGQSAPARRRCVEERKGGSERRVEGKREGRWDRGRSDRSRENNTRQRELE